MANSNGIITPPIGLQEVYSLLGVAKQGTYYDVGYICSNSHGRTNKASRYKPVKNSSLSELSESNFKSLCYGFGDKNTSSDIASRKWDYIPPTGGNSSPYRLTDFANYNHKAANFCSIQLPASIKGTSVNVATKNTLTLNGNQSQGTLGVKDIYPKEVKFWGVRVKFTKSGKTLYTTIPIESNVYPIVPALWYDLVNQSTDGLDIQVTQFFSTGRGASLLSYTTTNPESVGESIYPVYAPSGERTSITTNYGGSVSKIYTPSDGNENPSTSFYYSYSNTQWWNTVVKDSAGLGIGRFKSLDAYMIGVSSEIVNNVREYKSVFEYRLPLDNTTYAKVTQGSSTNLYNVSLAMNNVFSQGTLVDYYIFFVDRNTTSGAQYVRLTANYTLKHS